MSGAQLYEFASASQLLASPEDADSFFNMATGTDYRSTLRISPDRFDSALVRVFSKMSSQRHIKLDHACNTLVRDHLVPLCAELFGQPLEPHAHAVAYGYGGPSSMWPRYGQHEPERFAPPCTPYSRTHGGMTRNPHAARASGYMPSPGSRRFMTSAHNMGH